MPFLIDKYRPNSPKESFFNNDLIDLLQIMSKDEAIPHIIFYGPDGSGKKTIIKLLLNMLFDKTVNNLNDAEYEINGSGSNKSVEVIKQSNYHIVIEPKNNNSDRFLINDIVKLYAQSPPMGVNKTNRSFKVVLINNIDSLSYYAQASLRRTMERYNDKCRFITRCKSLSKVSKPLQSRCICLRVPSPSDIEMFKYLFVVSIKEGMNLSLEKFRRIIKNANGNIKNALWELEANKLGRSLRTDYDTSINEIMKLLLESNIDNIMEIRNKISTLMITNFDETVIMRNILDAICVSDRIKLSAKQEIILYGAEMQYQLVKCRREIMQFTALITKIIKILHSENGLIK